MNAVMVLAVLSVGLAADDKPSKKEVLERAAAYVDRQAELLPQLVAEERSSQTLHERVRRSTAPPPRVTELRADFA
jgi:hypothetical protein